MRIQDFESRSGLERATIRFYEKEGLLNPHRTENGYRDYSEVDLAEVKKIKLLRQLGLPLDRIRELQQGIGNFGEVMNLQIEVLNDRAETQQWAKEVCREIIKAQEEYSTLDADKYLDMLVSPPPPKPAAKPETYREILRLDHHPGRRFFARLFDVALLYSLIIFFVVVILRVREDLTLWLWLVGVLVWWLMIPLEALLLTLFGTTLGKQIFGVQLSYHFGVRFSFQAALRRSWLVFRYGLGWNLPCYNVYRLFKSYLECDEYPDMLWDDETDVSYRMWTQGRFGGIFAAVLIITWLLNATYDDILLPKYRNELTISQFSENYNFYANLYQIPYRLNPDGTWVDDPSTGSDNLCDFSYTLENGYITTICLDRVERGFECIDPLHRYQTTALIAFAAAQPVCNTSNIVWYTEYWKDITWYYRGDRFEKSMCGVQFNWEIEYKNCSFDDPYDSGYLIADNKPKRWNNQTDAYLHIVMTIEKDE